MGTKMENPQKVMYSLEKAIELELINDTIRSALKEFLEWYEPRYSMPIDAELDVERVSIHIYHDTTEDLENCVVDCIEQTKRHVSKEVDEFKIRDSCYSGCIYEVSGIINARFDDVREKLLKHLNKYGIKYEWREGWEGEYKYLEINIFQR